jgi:hypothetical protein
MNDSKPLHDVVAEVFSADEPAVGDGPAAVFTRAARIRTRQRITVAAAATAIATTAVVVAGASLAAHSPGGRPVGGFDTDPAQWAAASPTSDPSTSDPATPNPTARPPRSTAGSLDIDVYATLTRLLPLDTSTEAITDPLAQLGFAAVDITDPQGTTRVQVNVELDSTAAVGPLIDCAARTLPPGTQCAAATMPSGARMLTSDGPNADGVLTVRMLQVDLLYPDGRRVFIGEWNAADEKRGAASRLTPLLTLDQLVTIATAPDWRM